MKVKKAGRRRQQGMTIIEVLVVMAVIMVLAAMLVAAVGKARDKAKMGRWEGYMRNERVADKQALQLMFMEGSGVVVENQAQGIDIDAYDREKHDAVLVGNTRWEEGRWFRKKGARPVLNSDYILSSYIDIIDKETLEGTVILWLKPYLTDLQGVFNTQVEDPPATWSDGNYPNLVLDETNQLGIIQGGLILTTDPDLRLPANKWSMVAMVQRSDGIHVYRYGEGGERGHEVVSDVLFTNPVDAFPRRTLFGNTDGFSGAFNGVIDEIVIYQRALNESQLFGHFKMGRP